MATTTAIGETEATTNEQDEAGDWDDLLGTGTVLKQILVHGERNQDPDLDMIEAPRKFFALIDIETKADNKLIATESYTNYLINSDADLFTGAHLVIPLMDINEKSRYIFDPKFAYGSLGNLPHIKPNQKLECIITLKFRSAYDEFLAQLSSGERLKLAQRKKDRGKFWYQREDYQNAIVIYQTLNDLCQINDEEVAVEAGNTAAGTNRAQPDEDDS